jgi:hypothetical protein
VNPIDELAGLLPPAQPSRELPGHARHKTDVLAAVAADATTGRPRLILRRPAVWRWLVPVSAAVAVALIALLSVVVPRLSSIQPGAPPSVPAGLRAGGPPAGAPHGSQLTVPRRWSVSAASLRAVTVTTTSGQVTVTGGAGSSATITATPRYRGSAPVITSQVTAGLLTITASCPQEPDCQASLTLHVPAGLPVHARSDQGNLQLTGLTGGAVATTDQGNVTLTHLSGHVTATTDEGDIDLTAVAGTVTARTSQGDISGAGLSATSATLSSQQGDVDAVFWVAPRLVAASTQEGSVYLRLPSSVVYHVIASSQLGSRSVRVPQAPGSAHVVKASTQLGSVTVTG